MMKVINNMDRSRFGAQFRWPVVEQGPRCSSVVSGNAKGALSRHQEYGIPWQKLRSNLGRFEQL